MPGPSLLLFPWPPFILDPGHLDCSPHPLFWAAGSEISGLLTPLQSSRAPGPSRFSLRACSSFCRWGLACSLTSPLSEFSTWFFLSPQCGSPQAPRRISLGQNRNTDFTGQIEELNKITYGWRGCVSEMLVYLFMGQTFTKYLSHAKTFLSLGNPVALCEVW